MLKNLLSLTVVALLFSSSFYAQNFPLDQKDNVAQTKWVDSIYGGMSLNEKVGQLFMVRAYSNKGDAHENQVYNLIKSYHIGGIIYSKGGPVAQAKLNNKLQNLSKTPLLIGMDAEWGLSMRLDSTFSFPWNMTLGAITDNKLIEQTGRQLGEHCKRIGVHYNFAPVVDINTNPKNPIIGNRSFGEERDNVTEKALAFMKGMQDAGVLANAKHFPGHGDTDSDSHKTLPTISFSKERIDSIELYPYRRLIDEGLASVMVGHLNVPSLEKRSGYPSSISHHIVSDILKDSLNFKGLIFTDALEMKGVANIGEPGDADLEAFLAGNDVLLISEDTPRGISKIITAYNEGKITEDRLEHSVKKILKSKYKVGLNNYQPIETKNLVEDLNRIKDKALYGELIENAITIVKNADQILPLRRLDSQKVAFVKFGDADGSVFYNELKKYTKVHQVKSNQLDEMLRKLDNYNTVIISLHRSNANPWKSYNFTERELVWLHEISRKHKVIVNVFTKPYALQNMHTTANLEAIMVSYQNSAIAQQKAAQIIFGALSAKGKLPVSIGHNFKAGDGVTFNELKTLSYGIPERVGMSSEKLKKLDSLSLWAVKKKTTPGLQLLVARKGKVIYNKSFGHHTFNKKITTKNSDIYDIASITKIVATLPLLMELEEAKAVSLDSKLQELIPDYRNSNKAHITVKQMLSHYAKLKPWIPFYTATLDSVTKKTDSTWYRKAYSNDYSIKVSENLYLKTVYKDSMYNIIKSSDLLDRLRYRYSDMPYYILKTYIEEHYKQGLDQLVQNHFYKPLGANYTTYNPSSIFSNSQIPPTEEDDYYRDTTVQGYVHDMGAAMQNGVGGHAGIFSNANDLAKIMQMYLQKGFYGGRRYFQTETINKFNTCYYCEKDNRRGVGFDKPQLGDKGPTCGCISMTSFGHSGFTGTYAWADPEEEIVYIFLSNRTYPSASNNSLLRENVRTEIQRLIYEAILE
ncbi:MAG: beta-N-acetylglucosaminidase [Bacteroidetes bacterium MedPE-SWsnd-G2]|nr:MAG: beta-N-acetylglucosaminidase [Bacteroidetes bacterium MedPE-SWsnd-G2]